MPYPYTTYNYQPSYQPAYAQPNQTAYAQPAAASYTPTAQSPLGIIWVDGEVGAKAFQLPNGWPVNTPLPLWDTNDTIIYLKSTNPMGMPNPLQKIHYRMDENQQSGNNAFTRSAAPALMAGDSAETHTEYATKDDLERMKKELRDSIADAVATGKKSSEK